MVIAQIIGWTLGVYVALGLLFALVFVARGAGRMDPSVEQSTRGFRWMIVPGATALWPLLLWRLVQGVKHPPTERNAHREAAQ